MLTSEPTTDRNSSRRQARLRNARGLADRKRCQNAIAPSAEPAAGRFPDRLQTSVMTLPIEDYALIGDTQTAGLVGRDGSIDWACFPRFDSGACFAALLGEPRQRALADRARGHVRSVRPPVPRSTRSYWRRSSKTDDGAVRLIDFMPLRGQAPRHRPHRRRRARAGHDADASSSIRFDYGRVVPWVRRSDGTLTAIGGPDALCLRGDVEVHGEGLATVGAFVVGAGERRSFILTWYPSHEDLPAPRRPDRGTATRPRAGGEHGPRAATTRGRWREAVGTLAARAQGADLSGRPAASSPRRPRPFRSGSGGVRNWDYRYCWLRDATLTLYALMLGGYTEEAARLARVAAARGRRRARPAADHVRRWRGERRLTEYEVPWLPGYEGSTPGSHRQRRPSISCSSTSTARSWTRCTRRASVRNRARSLGLVRCSGRLLDLAGIQMDGAGPRHLGGARAATALHPLEGDGLGRVRSRDQVRGACSVSTGPIDKWKQIRAQIHAEVCARGYDRDAQRLHAVLWPLRSRRQPAHDSARRLPSRRPTRGSSAPWRRSSVSSSRDGFVLRYRTEHGRERTDCRPARACFCPAASGWRTPTPSSGERDDARASLRAAARAAQRCRAAVRGIRPGGRANARELPAGLLASRPRQHGLQPERDPPAARAPSSRRRRRVAAHFEGVLTEAELAEAYRPPPRQ